jgi:hypothetical protein
MIVRPSRRKLKRTMRRSITNRLAILTVVLASVSGCEGTLDELLAVERPGQIPVDALSDPTMVAPVVAGVQSNFECAFKVYIDFFGLWTGVLGNGNARDFQVEQRNAPNITLYDRSCEGGSYTNPSFGALHMARSQAKFALGLIDSFTDAQVPNKPVLIGKSRLYEAYSTLLLTEAFCGYVEDNGPVMTRAEGFRLAEDRFGKVLEQAALVTDQNVSRNLRNAALIGRARSRLNLWSLNQNDGSGVVSDALQVADKFVFYATYEAGVGGRRSNTMYTTNINGKGWMGITIRPLRFLGGVWDPRVPLYETTSIPTGTRVRGWASRKFTSEGDDLPVGTWREAKLMIAEVQGGQAAVDIINQLRATVTEAPYVVQGTYNLPRFSSTDPTAIKAEVRTERVRETLLMGIHMGDLMRWRGQSVAAPYDAFPTGVPERGSGQYNETYTCRPFPDYEVIGNPNIDAESPYPTTPL